MLMTINYQIKAFKVYFFPKEMNFLLHTISREGIQLIQDKVEAIARMPPPKNLRDIQVFLGMMGYYHQFIPKFAQLSEPLVCLLKKNISFQWGTEQKAAYETMKLLLQKRPILSHPNYGKLFILFTDASDYAIGAILAQLDEKGVDHPVLYFSKMPSKAERNYSVTKKECLAVLLAVKYYRPFLYGTSFTEIMDHASLKWLQNMKDPTGWLARWALRLQHYNMKIEHCTGNCHIFVDGLTWLPILHLDNSEVERLYDLLMTSNDWEDEDEPVQRKLAQHSCNTKVESGKLYKQVGVKWLPYLRPSERVPVTLEAHSTLGHGGVKKTYEWIKD